MIATARAARMDRPGLDLAGIDAPEAPLLVAMIAGVLPAALALIDDQYVLHADGAPGRTATPPAPCPGAGDLRGAAVTWPGVNTPPTDNTPRPEQPRGRPGARARRS